MNIYIYNNYSVFQLTWDCCFYLGIGDVTVWYQSSGCYSGDRNDYMILKCVSGWWEQGNEPGLIHPQFGEVTRVFEMKVIQTRIPWQTPPLIYLQHQCTLKVASQWDFEMIRCPVTQMYCKPRGKNKGCLDCKLTTWEIKVKKFMHMVK
jgi:hypothetical protein